MKCTVSSSHVWPYLQKVPQNFDGLSALGASNRSDAGGFVISRLSLRNVQYAFVEQLLVRGIMSQLVYRVLDVLPADSGPYKNSSPS